MIIGTAGHVDHGKTALVKALTGVDTDRLAEERRRGLTIELGFAPLVLPGGLTASLVDVPGHAHFIPTMLSGAAGMDLVLLVVAADEGPMPQTAEHLDILSLLGVRGGVVVYTRTDLASPVQLEHTRQTTRQLLEGSVLSGAPEAAVCAPTGEGIPRLRQLLAELLLQTPPPPDTGHPVLHADRVFSVDGSGTVVTGTLTGGTLHRGDTVQLYPGSKTARVRSLQCHGRTAESLPPASRAAVNLAGIEAAQLHRGDTLALPGTLACTDRADVRLRVLPDAPFPIRNNSQLHLHLGGRALMCRCILLGQEVLRPGETGFAQLRFSQPVAALPGQRYVVRFFSPLATVGGGVLLDLDPPRRGRCDPVRLERLRILADGTPEERATLHLNASGMHPVRPTDPAPYRAAGGIEADGAFLSPQGMEELYRQVLLQVQARPGITRGALLGLLFPPPARREAAFLDAAADQLNLVREGEALFPPGSGTAPRQDAAVEDFYRQAGLTPPSNAEAECEFSGGPAAFRQAADRLVRQGVLTQLSRSYRIHTPACRQALELLRTRFGAQPFTLAQARDALGISRKYTLLLLEYWDRQRLTRHIGDARTLS